MTLTQAHRTLGLAAGLLWLFQFISGAVLVFQSEIEGAFVPGERVALSPAGLGERMRAVESAGGKPDSLWVANSAADRFKLSYEDSSGVERSMQLDGAGRVLRDDVDGGFLATLSSLHQSLNAGDFGKWLLTVSGALLISNLILGLKLAWPPRGMWRRVLLPTPARGERVRLYGLHRAIGLWLAIPTLFVVGAGLCLLHKSALESVLADPLPTPASFEAQPTLSPQAALETALARFPGSTLTMLSPPRKEAPWYRIRLHAPDESPRVYGATNVYVSAVDGRILQTYEPANGTAGRLFIDGLYPFHTGSLGGLIGRLMLLAVGAALITLGIYGLRMWLNRRTSQRRAPT